MVTLEAVWWTMFSIATFFIILRFWARILKRSLGLDNIVKATCYVLFLAEAIMSMYHKLITMGQSPTLERREEIAT